MNRRLMSARLDVYVHISMVVYRKKYISMFIIVMCSIFRESNI